MQGGPGASDGPTDSELNALSHRLNNHIQIGLQNDIARIFDESLYTDIELILGKLKISTHKCILKTRSPRFYETLENILKKGVSKETFIEIESFISDTYSECNVKKQEDEILEYLKENTTDEDLKNCNQFSIRTLEPFTPDSDLFLTPKTSPSCVKNTITSTVSNKPEQTVDNFSIFPEDTPLLEQELTEQDELLTAFQSILKTQKHEAVKLTPASRIKPTTLSLRSSHTSKVFKHSGSCDFSRFKRLSNHNINPPKNFPYKPRTEGHEWANPASQFYSPCRPRTDPIISYQEAVNKKDNSSSTLYKDTQSESKNDENSQINEDFTPDSLIDEDDDNSSPSDYLTPAANFCPSLLEPKSTNPVFVKSRSHSMPVEMDNLITAVDSGLETTSASSGLVESYGSPKEHTESETSGIDFTESLFSSDPLKDDDSQSYSYNYSRHPEQSHPDPPNAKELTSIREKGGPTLVSQSSQTLIGESSNSPVIGRIIDKVNLTNHASQTCQDLVELGISVNSDSPYGSEWGSERYTNSNTAEIDSDDLNLNYRCETEFCKTSSKEEKERLNEEIVILESSSVSSETGSWESIFPPKNVLEIKEVCNSFIQHEKIYSSDYCRFVGKHCVSDINRASNMKKITPCFIDAATLADDGELFLNSASKNNYLPGNANQTEKSMQITNSKLNQNDISPSELKTENSSEESNNDDSLELEEFDAFEKTINESELSYDVHHNDLKISGGAVCTILEQQVCEKSFNTSDYQSNSNSLESTCVVPNTPSNSILQIEWKVPFPGNDIKDKSYSESPKTKSHFDSPHRMQKCDESMPIISGGATVEDFVTNFQQTSHSLPNSISPLVRDGSKGTIKSSWIVDMSDCKKDGHSTKQENTLTHAENIVGSFEESHIDEENFNSEKKKSLGFYVDFSNIPNKTDDKIEDSNSDKTRQVKKSLFSMYVDLGDNKNLKEMPSRLIGSTEGRKDSITKATPNIKKSPVSLDEFKSSEVLKNNNVEKIVDKIPIASQPQVKMLKHESDMLSRNNKPGINVNRHSWNFSESCSEMDPQNKLKNFHKQKSLSLSKFGETSHDFVNQVHKKKDSNYSLSDNSLADDVTYSKSESSYSENVPAAVDNKKENLPIAVGINLDQHVKKHKCDAKLNETFDKSSTCSEKNNLTEDTSPTITDNEELTFHPEQVKVEVQEQKMTDSIEGVIEDLPTSEPSDTTSMNSKDTEKEVESDTSKASNFVKLSDLDKPLPVMNLDISREYLKNPVNSRMTRSIPEGTWGEDNRMTHSTEIFSSFHSENIYSLTRLFPHLKNELSKSTPGSLGAQNRSLTYLPTPGMYLRDTELQYSDVTEHSSLQSSSCFSNNDGSIDEQQSSSLLRCKSRLGEDLLRMFLEEIAPDVTIDVGGRKIRAHKCILSSRCLYFAGILSGCWVQSAGNVISLDGFSFNVVHFALCHIYSGASTIPDSISIFELAALSDMLSLEGLKEVVMYTLKVKYCHLFHKPCPVCSVGVLECLPLSSAYGLDEIYRKSLDWITKYFVRIWPTKEFAALPRELIDKCYQQHVVYMTADNVLETVTCCDKLLALLPRCRWSAAVSGAARRLLGACVRLAGARLPAVLGSRAFRALAGPGAWTLPRLEDALAAAAERAAPRQACEALAVAQAIMAEEGGRASHAFVDLLRRLVVRCEGVLVRAGAWRSLVRTPAWNALDARTRTRLQELSCLVRAPRTEDKQSLTGSKVLDLHQIRRTIQSHSTTGTSSTRSASSSSKVSTTLHNQPHHADSSAVNSFKKNPSAVNKTDDLKTRKSLIPRCRNSRFENTKSRYLEPRPIYKSTSDLATQPTISSGETSRNTSPALKRAPPFLNKAEKHVPKNNDLKCIKKSEQSISDSSLLKTNKPFQSVTTEKVMRNLSDTKVPKLLSTNKASFIPAAVHKSEENINCIRTIKEKETHLRLAKNISPVKNVSKVLKTTVTENKNKISPLKKTPVNGHSNVHITKISSPHLDSKKILSNRSIVDKKMLPKVTHKASPKVASKALLKSKAEEHIKDGGQIKSRHSLYNPTQSTKAKSVSHPNTQNDSKTTTNTKIVSKSSVAETNNTDQTLEDILEAKQSSIPVMERSGTFLKDEPTIIDKFVTSDCTVEMYPQH